MPEYPDNVAFVTFVTTVSRPPHEEQVPGGEQAIVLIRLPAQKQPNSVACAPVRVILVESRNCAYVQEGREVVGVVFPIPFQQAALSLNP